MRLMLPWAELTVCVAVCYVYVCPEPYSLLGLLAGVTYTPAEIKAGFRTAFGRPWPSPLKYNVEGSGGQSDASMPTVVLGVFRGMGGASGGRSWLTPQAVPERTTLRSCTRYTAGNHGAGSGMTHTRWL